ncbi:protein C3orf33 homolog isoform X5 [Canis lupus familiaris]|uniref:protein C3orf33 homolog isoform X5 n=1 Tax=Canis lupus familiaris TaxID=9615 RepID=UPI0018F46BE2|nr:protein C3orf33 homolog isoform X5 [Canis lupus familiaris]
MAGPPVATASRPRDPDGAAPNVVARVSQWADDHLRLVRVPQPPAGRANISTVMAVAGTMLLLRSIRMTSKFTSSSDIPVEFIRKNVKLRGRLRRITEDGLEIEHIPITLPIISSWKKEPCGVLLVKLAGVELTETGKLWLQEELKPSQLLWFQLLGKENSALFCYLLVNKVGLKERTATARCIGGTG